MKITVIIDGQEKEIELSDEQINAIVKRYFESPTLNYCKKEIELKPIDTDFGVMEQPDDLLHYGDIRTD